MTREEIYSAAVAMLRACGATHYVLAIGDEEVGDNGKRGFRIGSHGFNPAFTIGVGNELIHKVLTDWDSLDAEAEQPWRNSGPDDKESD